LALPVLSWREVLKALGKKGFKPIRQRGSHIYLQNESGRYTVVPRHAEIKKSTLMKILAEAGLSREEFLDLL
jgi:predicted RNA binding protein YcfA (HicA-like mRNA interferase family)